MGYEMGDRTLDGLFCGVSTRDYGGTLQEGILLFWG